MKEELEVEEVRDLTEEQEEEVQRNSEGGEGDISRNDQEEVGDEDQSGIEVRELIGKILSPNI